jgi:hypothetical protein
MKDTLYATYQAQLSSSMQISCILFEAKFTESTQLAISTARYKGWYTAALYRGDGLNC